MSDEAYLAGLTFNTIYSPALKSIEQRFDSALVKNLRSVLKNAEHEQPGFLLEFTKRLINKNGLRLDLQECMLRLQNSAPSDDFITSSNSGSSIDPLYQELSYRALNLRKILARIPDEMTDRRTFLETIKEIASCIKKLLDATNVLIQTLPENSPQSGALEQRKREFVKYSKKFSNTLKEYFKGEESNTVFASANQLIFQTTQLIKVVPERVAF